MFQKVNKPKKANTKIFEKRNVGINTLKIVVPALIFVRMFY